MQLDWENLFRRYIWDSRTTPYLVPLTRLNRRQADYEISAYCLFLGLLFAFVAIAALTTQSPGGKSPGMAMYAFTVVCACILFGVGKVQFAAFYLSATPLAGLLFVIMYFEERELFDTALVAVILLILLRYSFRIVAVAKAYPTLPEAPGDDSPRRRLFKR